LGFSIANFTLDNEGRMAYITYAVAPASKSMSNAMFHDSRVAQSASSRESITRPGAISRQAIQVPERNGKEIASIKSLPVPKGNETEMIELVDECFLCKHKGTKGSMVVVRVNLNHSRCYGESIISLPLACDSEWQRDCS